MDEEYDVVILGTGLKECILSGVLSVEGKKVLHMDRNPYYGGDSASLNLVQLFDKFKKGKPTEALGPSREYNVDLIPKFIMASGLLVNILIKTDVTRYLEFKAVDGSFVVQGGKVHKIPSNKEEALKSSLLGMFEKKNVASFLSYIDQYNENDPSTYKKYDLKNMTSEKLFKEYGLGANSIDFIGHAMALYSNDSYLTQPALEMVRRAKVYIDSVLKYGNSPYIYPLYGLGEMPQGFARLSAIYGGTYMLNKPIEEIVYGPDGKVIGVKSEGEVAKCKMVIGDPSYFPQKVKKVGQIVRCICILSHPIPGTNNAESAQIIVSQKETNRKNDIYISCISHAHNVAPKGKYIALVSSIVETETPQKEIEPALKVLGPIDDQFFSVDDMMVPLEDGTKDRVFISKSFDPETHFNQSCEDILGMYKRITGKDLDLTPPKKSEEEDS
jgi:Rab GDP dissociation inhibitor